MRKIILVGLVAIAIFAMLLVISRPDPTQAQALQRPSQSPPATLEDAFLRWPVPPGGEAYVRIDGRRLHQYVVEQTAIGRRYRDAGNAYWGRIIGTASDAESAQWVANKFRQAGLRDVHIEPHDLAAQFLPSSWEITAIGNGKKLRLESAWPASPSAGTAPEGLDLEAVYVGMGSETEFAAQDVKGKAVFLYSPPRPGGGERGVHERAQAKGAAAIVEINGLPGNLKTQLHLTSSATPVRVINVPTFAVGKADGFAVRDLIGETNARQPVRVQIRLDARMVPNLTTATVWGTLPGTTDETIYVIAHRDGYFDSATDNASGVATMIGLAEYYSQIPEAQRRRTMIFLGISGHHPPPQNPSVEALLNRKEKVFAKTALVINSEHTSTLQTYLRGDVIRRANTYTAQLWYAGGSTRPKLQEIAVKAFREFGVSTYAEPEQPGPPGSDLSMKDFWRFVPGLTSADYNMYFHTDEEKPETVPWTGLEATTRAYAKIIDEVNKLNLSDLQRMPETTSSRQ